ncbi:MAG: hypothetical protein Q8P63_00450 [Candidatus Nealsonbacteria bacterium]|nr:hypothetical protein [Candidatus Nealsonbacteria bacterium]
MPKDTNNLPYFLRFDIRLYYPSINHPIILKKLTDKNKQGA